MNFLEGVHTTYNSLSSRFEIAPDDNRNVSYPFEYCWQKSSEAKAKSDKSADEEDEEQEDEFEEMWSHSIQTKALDSAPNFGNEVQVKGSSSKEIVDNKVSFANELEVVIPKIDDKSSTDKKS